MDNLPLELSTLNIQEEDDKRSKRGGHRLFDHSFFPDFVVLRVRTRNFVVSASYLALQSSFFYDLFYGPLGFGLNERYEIDVDPHVFGDLLDMVYPSYKKTNCCGECSSSLVNRLNVALQLKTRAFQSSMKSRKVLSNVLRENTAWDCYSNLFGNYAPRDEIVAIRDASDSLEPLTVSEKFPDSTTVVVSGLTVLVSASTLSLHSESLAKLLYKDDVLQKHVKFDVDIMPFVTFSQASVGEIPSDYTVNFLNALCTLGATYLYDFCISENTNKIVGLNQNDASHLAMLMLEHYSAQPNLDLDSMNYMQVFLKCLDGTTLTIDCHKGESTPVIEFKMLVEDKTGVPVDHQRLIYGGHQLEKGRTLKDVGVSRESTIHMALRLNGC